MLYIYLKSIYYFHIKLDPLDMVFCLHKSMLASIHLHVFLQEFTNSLFNCSNISLRTEASKFHFYYAYLYANLWFVLWKAKKIKSFQLTNCGLL